jgi:REP element-mobilizing transposase RayT
MDNLQFFNPYKDIRFTANRLPHWQQKGAVYFVTFRLADAVPRNLRSRWESEREAWLRVHPQPWSGEIEREYHNRFSGAIERWLDAGHGSCLLRRHDCAAVVAEALRHFDGERIVQIAWVVMPNHVHALFVLNSAWLLEDIILSWKGFTARHINARLGRAGGFWQRDYFDRLVRNAKHLANCIRYIRRNPQKARLHEGEFVLYEGELAKAIQ